MSGVGYVHRVSWTVAVFFHKQFGGVDSVDPRIIPERNYLSGTYTVADVGRLIHEGSREADKFPLFRKPETPRNSLLSVASHRLPDPLCAWSFSVLAGPIDRDRASVETVRAAWHGWSRWDPKTRAWLVSGALVSRLQHIHPTYSKLNDGLQLSIVLAKMQNSSCKPSKYPDIRPTCWLPPVMTLSRAFLFFFKKGPRYEGICAIEFSEKSACVRPGTIYGKICLPSKVISRLPSAAGEALKWKWDLACGYRTSDIKKY